MKVDAETKALAKEQKYKIDRSKWLYRISLVGFMEVYVVLSIVAMTGFSVYYWAATQERLKNDQKALAQIGALYSPSEANDSVDTPAIQDGSQSSQDPLAVKIDSYKLKPKTKILLTMERTEQLARHQRAVTALMARTWVRFTTLTLGILCVCIGCGFVVAKIRTDKFTAGAEGNGIKASISTTSPGLILVICGVILIIIPNIAKQSISSGVGGAYVSSQMAANTNSDNESFLDQTTPSTSEPNELARCNSYTKTLIKCREKAYEQQYPKNCTAAKKYFEAEGDRPCNPDT